jgi:short-subunit dehydrogenase
LAQAGANLVITARSEDKLEALATEIRNTSTVNVDVIASDLSVIGSARKLAESLQAKNLQVDLLVNNAGFGKWGDFLEFSVEDYTSMLNLNINSLVELSHLLLPHMLDKNHGGIINVASSAAFVPVPFAAVYSASKSFVLYFPEALFGECQETGVSVLALCPGGTKTNFAAVANDTVDVSNRLGDTPEMVAETGLSAFLEGDCYIIAGKKNKKVALLPRLLSRKRVIKMSGDMWKRVIGKA